MSRILRRPMFRGGRVDSRGTGIASGLSYAKGGSVNTPKRGLVDEPGGYAGYNSDYAYSDNEGWGGIERARRIYDNLSPKMLEVYPDFLDFFDSGVWEGQRFAKGGSVQDRPGYGLGGALLGLGSLGMKYGIRPAMKYAPKVWQGTKNLFKPKKTWEIGKGFGPDKPGIGQKVGEFLWKDPLIKWPLKTVGGGAKGLWSLAKKPATAAGVGYGGYQFKDEIKDLWDEYSPWADEKAGGREFVGDELEIVGDPRDLPTEKALTPDQIRVMELENLIKEQMADAKKAAEGDEESIDIDKEKFAKLLGGDKARGEDISNMLMSFAGKALKEGATTKSAFGEFFEEESKRPSSKTKIDQAAAQLAINKYIKGEMTKKEAETYLKRLELQYSMQTEGKKKSIGEYYLASDEPGFAGKVKEAVIAAYGQEGMIPDFEVTTSKKMEEDFEFGDKDVGVIFIETDTKKAYTYNSQGQPVPVLSG